jgi:hypothetical protein
MCGSKTSKCPDCGVIVKNSEKRAHKISENCDLMREIQKDRLSTELQKFQQEEEKKAVNKILS